MSTRRLAAAIAWIDPATLFARGPARLPHAFWLDAGTDAAAGWSWLGAGTPVAEVPRDLVLDLRAEAPDTPGAFAGGHVGWFGYDAAAARAGAPATADRTDGPQEAWLRVRRLVAFDHAARRAWVIAEADDLDEAAAEVDVWRESPAYVPEYEPPAVPDAEASARDSPAHYRELIERCRDAIRAGDAYQLCLTTRFAVTASAPLDPVAVYLRLRAELPAPRGGLIRVGEHALLSASPERFLQVCGGFVRTRPIKGTRPRGATPSEDDALARELRDSVKERAENVMIVDLMRNDLQRVCLPGSVAVERLLEVESYSAVHQLVSTVAGRLRPGTTFGRLLDAALPAGSMTGAPKLSAMAILHGLESGARGVFAGCFGWLGDDGRADLAMIIRSIVVHPGGAYVGAGGGITYLSDADEEWAEVALKVRGPLHALGAALPAPWSD